MTDRSGVGRKQSLITTSNTQKAFWRGVRTWVCHNHKLYYSWVIFCGFSVYNFWAYVLINYYQNRNYHRSLRVAELLEREYQAKKAAEEAAEEDADEE